MLTNYRSTCSSPQNNYVYFVLTCAPTGIGKLIRLVTRYPFSHVSIALSDHPNKFYSFARYYQCAPFYAGFTEESAMRYKGHSVPVRVYRVPISDLQMSNVCNILQNPDLDRKKYIYNLFSAINVPLQRRILISQAYTCAEFALQIMNLCGLPVERNSFYSIKALGEVMDPYLFYQGEMKDFAQFDGWGNDAFLTPLGRWTSFRRQMGSIGLLFARKLQA